MASRSPLSECDFNLHKSNSTYFTDLDGARAQLSGLLFSPLFFGKTEIGRCNLVVSAVSCVFRREIKPQQPYEIWTKIASWDEKWLYMVTHFVEKDRFRPREYLMQSPTAANNPLQYPGQDVEATKAVLASAVTRLVFKKGRLTIPPQKAMEACGLLPLQSVETSSGTTTATSKSAQCESPHRHDDEIQRLESIESTRKSQLPVVKLERGWDAVHGLFFAETTVLARRRDLMW
ncbi:hypothetical protein ACHAQA_008860 [Verticillium albo-atrum]